jgi:hypothetical protein
MSDMKPSITSTFFNRIFIVGMFICIAGFYSVYQIYSFKHAVTSLTQTVIVDDDYNKSVEILANSDDYKVINEAFHRIIWNYPAKPVQSVLMQDTDYILQPFLET